MEKSIFSTIKKRSCADGDHRGHECVGICNILFAFILLFFSRILNANMPHQGRENAVDWEWIFNYISLLIFSCAEVDTTINLHACLCTLTDFSLHGRLVSASFWLTAVIQLGPLFQSFWFSLPVLKEEEEEGLKKIILLGFAMSHTSKGARWERSDASKGEDSRDGGEDGPGTECAKKIN